MVMVEAELDLESSGDFLPALVEQSQQWLDRLAVASAVSNDFNRCVSNSVHFGHELIMFILQRLQYASTHTTPHTHVCGRVCILT